MNFKNDSEKNRMTFIFAGFYLSAAVMLILIFTVFWSSGTESKSMHPSANDELTQTDNFLERHLNNLQWLDKKFASLLKDSGIKANFDTIYTKIQQAESAFKKAIDSANNAAVSAKNLGDLNQIIYSYKLALENHQPIDGIQNGIALASKRFNNDQLTIAKLKDSLSKKEINVAMLNETAPPKFRDRYSVSSSATDYKILKNENEYLKSELKLMEAEMANKRDAQNSLDEAYKTLVNLRLGEANKSSNNSKTTHNPNTARYEGDAKQQ